MSITVANSFGVIGRFYEHRKKHAYMYKVPLRGAVDLRYPGGVASRKGETLAFQGYVELVPLLLLYALMAWYEVRRRVFVELDVNMSWFDLLLCTNHIHIHRDYWHKG